jgi:hypothetical protein
MKNRKEKAWDRQVENLRIEASKLPAGDRDIWIALAKHSEELGGLFSQIEAMQADVQAGRITKEKGDKQMQRLTEEAIKLSQSPATRFLKRKRGRGD